MRLLLFLSVLLVFLSRQALANSKTLIVNGVYAATYGDFKIDRGQIRDEDFSALHMRVGAQLLRFEYFGVGIGYQKVGFYTAQKNWDRTSKSHKFDYRGPFAELYLFPSSLFGFSVAAMTGDGYTYRELENPGDFGFTPSCSGCSIVLEKSELKINEFSGNVTFSVSRNLQLLLSAGTRSYTGRPIYQVENAAGETSSERNPSGKWEDSGSFIAFGIRGTNL